MASITPCPQIDNVSQPTIMPPLIFAKRPTRDDRVRPEIITCREEFLRAYFSYKSVFFVLRPEQKDFCSTHSANFIGF